MERNRVLAVAVVVLALLAGGYIYIVNFSGETPVATYPQANLDFEYHPETNSVTVSHRNGDNFDRQDTTALEVYVFPVNEARPSSPRTTIALPFTPGDTATISDVTDNDRVILLWRSESDSHIVGNFSVRTDENG